MCDAAPRLAGESSGIGCVVTQRVLDEAVRLAGNRTQVHTARKLSGGSHWRVEFGRWAMEVPSEVYERVVLGPAVPQDRLKQIEETLEAINRRLGLLMADRVR